MILEASWTDPGSFFQGVAFASKLALKMKDYIFSFSKEKISVALNQH